MATMLSAGMPILQALDVAARSMSNICMSNAILNIIPGVEAGRSVGECMRMSRDLPDMLVQMTAVGEATGSMEATLEVLAEFYDNEVDTTTARALSLLEPTIICVLAVFVVIILMAVYLPMFSMYDMI
jgi:type IV pilus assembly protein PilC